MCIREPLKMEICACVRMWNYLRGSFRYATLLPVFLQTWFLVNYFYNWCKFFVMNYVLLYFSFVQLFSCLGIQCIVDIITTNERATIFYAIVDVFTSSIYDCSWWTQIQSIVCWLAVFHILTHAESSVFKSFRVHIYDPFSKTRKRFELKTVQEQLAGIS